MPPKLAGGEEQTSSAASFFQIFSLPNMCKKTFICYYLWFSTALIYYGLTLNSNTLSTDLFTTFTIGKVGKCQVVTCPQALEFPSITLVIFLLLKTGRRITLIIFYSLAGVSLILFTMLTILFTHLPQVSLTLTVFIPLGVFAYEWPILVMNILGRVSAINTLAVCYIYSAEVFPTVVRNIGLGSSSFWARVSLFPPVVTFLALGWADVGAVHY